MSLMSVLSTAVSGLRVTQAGLNVVAQNVANADSAGYTKRRMTPVENVTGSGAAGVREGEIRRVFERTVQRQLWQENSGAGYTALRAGMTSGLERLYGPPGSSTALDTLMNGFSTAVDRLLDDPGNTAARTGVIDAGRTLAARLNGLTEGVQALRTEAEGRIASMVGDANTLLSGIERVNASIVASGPTAALEDERDRMIGELSQLIDLRVQPASNGGINISTSAGQTLFDGVRALTLAFDARATLGAGNSYDASPPSVGVLSVVSPTGARTDIVASQGIRSGAIMAALEMRDETLVQAQRQLDEIAAGLARAFSETDSTVSGPGPWAISPMPAAASDGMTLEFTVGGRFVRLGGTVAEINDALTANFGGSLTAGGALTLPGASVQRAATIAGGTAGLQALALFTDRGTNATFTGGGDQLTGFAGRIQINDAIASAPGLLVNNPTQSGDPTRPTFLRDALDRTQTFTAQAGLSGAGAFQGDLLTATRRTVEVQGAQAAAAARLDEGQQVALRTVESRFADVAGVDIDEQMEQLVLLQTAYGANARVMQAAREMFDALLRI